MRSTRIEAAPAAAAQRATGAPTLGGAPAIDGRSREVLDMHKCMSCQTQSVAKHVELSYSNSAHIGTKIHQLLFFCG